MWRLLISLAVLACVAAPAAADPPPRLTVGTIPVAPFIIKNADGTWSGISIDLWRATAQRLHLDYDIVELAPADLDDPAKLARLDAFVSLNVSAKREATLDLTHAFYSTGLAIAVSPKSDDGLRATFAAIFTPRFGKLIAALVAMLFIIGALMWLAERRRNAAQFGGSAAHGIGAGFWWSAVTMTTVGYGDKSPVTLVGRLLGLVWMFAALLIISSFTASIASALTVNQLSSSVSGPGDLPKVKVAAVEPSQAARYLQQRRIAYKSFATAPAALDALAAGDVEAVVYEAPILQYEIKNRGDNLEVLGGTFDNHGYAFGLRLGSPLRKTIDLAMLEIVATDDWSAILTKYLGTP